MSYRGTTTIPTSWKIMTDTEGNRTIQGTAYTAGIQGERKRVTCADSDWNSKDDNVFYHDESVRFTVDELQEMDLAGVPMWLQHKEHLPPVGDVLDSYVDRDGNLCIIGEVPNSSKYQQMMINLIDLGVCSDLSISYPLTRDPCTREVTRGNIDEISFVTEGHFDGCRVGVKASKRENHKTPRVETRFRFVKASLSGEHTKEKMATTKATTPAVPAPSTGDEEAEINVGKTNEDLVKAAAAAAKKRMDAIKRAEEADKRADTLAAKLKEAEDKLKKREDDEQKERDKYAAAHAAGADEVVAHMAEIAAEEAGHEVSPEWKDFQKGVLTQKDPMAMETATVQVACSKRLRAMKKQVDELALENSTLKNSLKMSATLAEVADEEADRYERRDLKAAARSSASSSSSSMMTADDSAPAVKRPAWAEQLMGGSKSFTIARFQQPVRQQPQQPIVNQRQLTAAAQAPAPAAAAAAAVVAPPQQQHQPSSWKEGYPVNEHSMRNNRQNRELWKFMQEVAPGTELDGANRHMAGMDMDARRNRP